MSIKKLYLKQYENDNGKELEGRKIDEIPPGNGNVWRDRDCEKINSQDKGWQEQHLIVTSDFDDGWKTLYFTKGLRFRFLLCPDNTKIQCYESTDFGIYW